MVTSTFRRRMFLLGTTALLIAIVILLPERIFRRARVAEQRVEHTLRVLNSCQLLLATMADAETGQRGYLLTGEERYLQPYQHALANQSTVRRNLRELTADSDGQQVRVANLDSLLDSKLLMMSRTIALRKAQDAAAALAMVASGEDKHLMDEIRDQVRGLQEEEDRVLDIRTTEVAVLHDSYLQWIFRLGGALLVVLLVSVGAVSEHDIRNGRRSAEALKISEQRFSTIANGIPQLCWVADASGSIFWYNQRWYEYTGMTPKDMEGRGWQCVHDAATLPGVLERWNNAITTKQPFEMVFPLRAADGTFHTFLTRVMPVRNRPGDVLQWCGTNTDISEQRQIEQALREHQERLRLAQQMAQVGAFEWNLQTGTHEWTPELEAMYGLAPGGSTGMPKVWEPLIYSEDREQTMGHVRDAMDTGNFESEWRIIWPDGAAHWIAGRGSVVKDDSGKPLRLIGVKIDITERKHAELEVLRLNAELEQRVRERTVQLESANGELKAFAYSVSHDLRAPLRGIDGWSLALLEDYGAQLDDGARTYLNRVRSETQRMGRLIDDMLQLSRVTRDEMTVAPLNLTLLANHIVASLREAQPQRSMEFLIHPDLQAFGDSRLMEIALRNLFSNAVKFTGKCEKPLIEFGSRQAGDETVFYLRDNGAGFDMTYAKALFGAFQRLHKVSEFPGNGIGLAIVQRVIRKHGGRVWAEAAVNRGATFYFTLGASS